MPLFEFQIVLPSGTSASELLAENLFGAGADDATLFASGDQTAVGFSREANTLEEALRTAIQDVQKAGVQAVRVESADTPIFQQINSELASRA